MKKPVKHEPKNISELRTFVRADLRKPWAFRAFPLFFLLLVAILLKPGRSNAVPPELIRAVPADPVAVYFYTDAPAEPGRRRARDALRWTATLVEQAYRIGLTAPLQTEVRAWLDVALSVGTILPYPHAVVLFDIRAKPYGQGGHRFDQLAAALLIYTQGQNELIEHRIQHLLMAYTNTEDGRLERDPPLAQVNGQAAENESRTTEALNGETLQMGTAARADVSDPVYTLRDRRLPPWAVIRWGPRDDYYVVTIGDQAWERVTSVFDPSNHSLADDPWFQQGFLKTRGEEASAALYVQFDELLNRTGPGAPELARKIRDVSDAIGLRDVRCGLWTLNLSRNLVPARCSGEEEPISTVTILSMLKKPDEDEFSMLAGPAPILDGDKRRSPGESDVEHSVKRRKTQDWCGIIPDAATGYTMIHVEPRVLLDRISRGYLAARSIDARRSSISFWRGLEADAGVRVGEDIFAHLGAPVIIHNHPPHALRLPLLWTVQMPIDGDAAALRADLDRYLDAVRNRMAQAGTPRLRRDPDGVWYLEFGLLGPAVTVTERWLVLSFSPQAVRENVKLLSPEAYDGAKRDASASEQP